MYSKSYDISGQKPDHVSQETHDKAKALTAELGFHFKDTQSVTDLYQACDGEVFDEVMRILNYNEPYVVRDIISGS